MKSAVLFLIFKREDTTKRVFDRIKQARPPRLYIAADGPRVNKSDEAEKCLKTRNVVQNIDWPCEVHRLYREQNLGCGKSVSSAISWFFEHEEQGIIIEDDVLPHIDFFEYCDVMLEKYKEDSRIQLIAGYSSFYKGYNSDVSYYMSSHLEIWGWASWRRVWNTYEYNINRIDPSIFKNKVKNRLPSSNAKFFIDIFDSMRRNPVDTWDYQLAVNQFLFDRYTILPYINMVENLGFGSADAAHTIERNDKISNHKSHSILPIRHPNPITIDNFADTIIMRNQGEYVSPIIIRVFNKIHYLLIKLIKVKR